MCDFGMSKLMMEGEVDCKKKELDFFHKDDNIVTSVSIILYHIIAIYQAVILKSSTFYLPTAYGLYLSGTKDLKEDEHTEVPLHFQHCLCFTAQKVID